MGKLDLDLTRQMSKYDGQVPPHSQELLFKLLAVGTHGEDRVLFDLQLVRDEIFSGWSQHKKEVVEVFTRSAAELGDKPILLGSLLILVNRDRSEIAFQLLEALKNTLDDALAAFNWREAKLVLRVIAVCATVNLLDPMEVLGLYNVLLGVLDEMNPKEERKDAFVSLVLSTLPWCALVLEQRYKADLQSMLDRIELYFSVTENRGKRVQAAKSVAPFTANCPYEQIDVCALLLLLLLNNVC